VRQSLNRIKYMRSILLCLATSVLARVSQLTYDLDKQDKKC